MTPATLDRRTLGRALLQRQQLLDRAPTPALEMIEHLVGMQSQAPLSAYVGLWSRVAGFETEELADLLRSRRAVRASLMRNTVHLVSARDALLLWRLIHPVAVAGFRGAIGRQLAGVDVDAVVRAGTAMLDGVPHTRVELGRRLGEQWPGIDPTALAYAVSYLVGTVQVTPRGMWGQNGPAALQTIESWLGHPVDRAGTLEQLVLRYLRAYGPASVRDIQQWSGLTKLREVVERLGAALVQYRDEDGQELLDVPDGPLPDPETPAPVRFLPEYDNILLSHADRRRIIPDGRRVPLPPGNGAAIGTVLIDGEYRADWRRHAGDDGVRISVDPHHRLSAGDRAAVQAETAAVEAWLEASSRRHHNA